MEIETVFLLFGLFSLVFVVAVRHWQEEASKKRRELLMLKYGDIEIVDKLMEGYFWVNQTEEQLLDSLGQPMDVDQKILKTKKKEIWKYSPTGKNRYALKITIENGLVVGWDKK